MSDPRPELRRFRRALEVCASVLSACLASLLVLLLAGCGGSSRPAVGHSAAACAGAGAPQVLSVAPTELGALRESVARVLPGRIGRLYEEGTISGSSFWSDERPAGPTISTTARREAGYEMRWWAPNGDDVVADVLVFGSPLQAADFLGRAAERRCGHALLSSAANQPPQGRNVAWLNPDGVAETDVYLARGSRVYRVADVPSGQRQNHLTVSRLRRTLATVDALACLLPGAHCASESRSVPA